MATKQQITAFIAQIAPIIQKYAKTRGYHVASPIIAQAGIESAWGTSKLASVHHNYFGLKTNSSWKGASVNMSTKEEYTPGKLTTIKDNFRAYASMEEGVKGYFDFISTKRYANLKDAKTPQKYLEYIKADGYATDSTYVSKNMATVNKYNLTQYDNFNAILPAQEPQEQPVNGNPYQMPEGNIKKGSKGNSVRWWQFELNRRGYKLLVDGICGDKTEAAIKDFQRQAGLQVDGVAGPQTRAAIIRLNELYN